MAKEQANVPLTPEHLDARTRDIIFGAVNKLALRQDRPYMLHGSFLQADSDLFGDDGTEVPDVRLGTYSEDGSLQDGRLKFVWFDETAKQPLLDYASEEYLAGQMEFAREVPGSYFHGVARLYQYSSGEGDLRVTAHGFEASNTDPNSIDNQAFANSVGLGSLWFQVHNRDGDPFEVNFDGLADKNLGLQMAQRLGALADTPRP